MTWRAIWTRTGTPFPHHADFATEAEAVKFAAGNGVETAVVPLDGPETGAVRPLGASVGDLSSEDERGAEKREGAL